MIGTEQHSSSKITNITDHLQILLLILKVPSCKLYNNKYMIASTQITNTEIFAFIAALVPKLLSREVLFINTKDNKICRLEVGYFSQKIANFTGKLRQNYKLLKCEIFRILLKYVRDHLSVLFQFALQYL